MALLVFPDACTSTVHGTSMATTTWMTHYDNDLSYPHHANDDDNHTHLHNQWHMGHDCRHIPKPQRICHELIAAIDWTDICLACILSNWIAHTPLNWNLIGVWCLSDQHASQSLFKKMDILQHYHLLQCSPTPTSCSTWDTSHCYAQWEKMNQECHGGMHSISVPLVHVKRMYNICTILVIQLRM